ELFGSLAQLHYLAQRVAVKRFRPCRSSILGFVAALERHTVKTQHLVTSLTLAHPNRRATIFDVHRVHRTTNFLVLYRLRGGLILFVHKKKGEKMRQDATNPRRADRRP